MGNGICYRAGIAVCNEISGSFSWAQLKCIQQPAQVSMWQGAGGRNVEQSKLDLTHRVVHDHLDAAGSKITIYVEVQNQWFVLIIFTSRSKRPLL